MSFIIVDGKPVHCRKLKKKEIIKGTDNVSSPYEEEETIMPVTFSSKGSLTYPGRGMHFDTVDATEWEGFSVPGISGGFWYRVELYREGASPVIKTAYYQRKRGNWFPFAGNQACAMKKRRMLSLYGEVEK